MARCACYEMLYILCASQYVCMYSAYAGVAPGEVSAALWKTVKILHNSAHTCTKNRTHTHTHSHIRYLTRKGSTFVKQKRKRRDKSEVDEFESEDWVEEDEEGDGDQYKNEYVSMDFAGYVCTHLLTRS